MGETDVFKTNEITTCSKHTLLKHKQTQSMITNPHIQQLRNALLGAGRKIHDEAIAKLDG